MLAGFIVAVELRCDGRDEKLFGNEAHVVLSCQSMSLVHVHVLHVYASRKQS